MKKLSLFAFILALVLGASASTVNFAGLPAVTPQLWSRTATAVSTGPISIT